jgi:peptide/nickel transport system permease protein
VSTPITRGPVSPLGARTIGFREDPDDPTPPVAMGAVGRSPWQIFWREFRRSPLALAGAAILIALYGTAIFADFLAPWPMARQDLDFGYHPPTPVHWFADGRFVGPYVQGSELIDLGRSRYRTTAERHPVRFFVRGAQTYRVLGLVPTNVRLFGVDPPGHLYLFGSDKYGRDQFSRLLYGSQISLSIGLIGIAITFLIGTLVGGLSGYLGGAFDLVVMRVTELIMSVPALYLILALRAAFPSNLPSDRMYLIIVIILAFIGWASLARIVRGMVLSLREFEYVNAARALGAGTLRILFRHIMPNTMSFLIVAATVAVPGYILGEVTLSFLGIGIQEPQASWGNMLIEAQNIRALTAFPWLLIPGVFIFIVVLAYNFLGDGLADALNPRKVLGGKS